MKFHSALSPYQNAHLLSWGRDWSCVFISENVVGYALFPEGHSATRLILKQSPPGLGHHTIIDIIRGTHVSKTAHPCSVGSPYPSDSL